MWSSRQVIDLPQLVIYGYTLNEKGTVVRESTTTMKCKSNLAGEALIVMPFIRFVAHQPNRTAFFSWTTYNKDICIVLSCGSTPWGAGIFHQNTCTMLMTGGVISTGCDRALTTALGNAEVAIIF
jgi:hypothetical protein